MPSGRRHANNIYVDRIIVKRFRKYFLNGGGGKPEVVVVIVQ